MIKITAEIRAFIDKAAAGAELAEDEYIDPSDGLIHCKKCGGQRQTVVPCFGKSGYFMPRCICQCQQEAEEQRKATEERQRRMERIKRRKAQGLQDRYLYDYTFANNNGQNPLMDKGRRLKIYYLTQASTRPPTSSIKDKDIEEAKKRYLQRKGLL